MGLFMKIVNFLYNRSLETFKLAGFSILTTSLLVDFSFIYTKTSNSTGLKISSGANPEIGIIYLLVALFAFSIYIDFKLRERKNIFREKILEVFASGKIDNDTKENLLNNI
jgi:hypothetical protein